MPRRNHFSQDTFPKCMNDIFNAKRLFIIYLEIESFKNCQVYMCHSFSKCNQYHEYITQNNLNDGKRLKCARESAPTEAHLGQNPTPITSQKVQFCDLVVTKMGELNL